MDGEANNDGSGTRISLSSDGKIIAIGAPWNDAGYNDAGHARVYYYDDNNNEWLKMGQDLDGYSNGQYFGYSVALSSDGKNSCGWNVGSKLC